MRYLAFLALCLVIGFPRCSECRMGAASVATKPLVLTDIVQRKRAAVLAWIASLPAQGKIMSGQMSWSDTTIEAVNTNYGKYPALRGFDWFAQSDPTLTNDIKEWAVNRGMVHLMYHMPNPFASNAAYNNLTDGNWTNLVTDSTTENTYWRVSLDKMADTLQSLQNDKIIVILRPFHEMNGTWFWWGRQNATATELKNAWIYMHNYFTTTKGLKNIIWMYGPNSEAIQYVDEQYPGHAYVDMVGVDSYGDLSAVYGDSVELAAVSGGKPFAVGEYGGCVSSGCSSGGTNISGNIPSGLPTGTTFWMNWESAAGNYFGLDQTNAGTATIFANPAVLTLDEMPSF